MKRIENMLKNRFDMTKPNSGFIDNFSDMEVCLGKGFLSINNMNTRGLDSWRNVVAEKLCQPYIIMDDDKRQYPICIGESEFYPWSAIQKGQVNVAGIEVTVRSSLCSPKTNTLLWFFEFESNTDISNFKISFEGKLAYKQKQHSISNCDNGVMCTFNHENKEKWTPIWSVRSSEIEKSNTDNNQFQYHLFTKPTALLKGKKYSFMLQVDYEVANRENIGNWCSGELLDCSADSVINQRKAWWDDTLSGVLNGKGDIVKKIRSAAGLVRCGCKWQNDEGNEVIAAYCSISNWSSLVCFWDSIIAATGMSYFNLKLSADAIRAAFARQKENGYVTSTTYKFAPHNEIYPQPPITGWALMKFLKNEADKDAVWDFIKEIIPKIHKLHQWYIQTQDLDGDGLPEWRFTGSIADNSPLYDRYAKPISKDLGDIWNIYIPPVASVSLASFLIKEAKCLAFFYDKLGDESLSKQYMAEAKELGEKLKSICFDGELFHDFDNMSGDFNKVITLYSFLPLWAGVEIQPSLKNYMIENYLLNSEHFFGEYPFPYVSYSEETYRPDGYWRGRIWPHVTLWMLELLNENGYEAQADEAAERLLNMMNQREELLENYNSCPDTQGGGEPDFLWTYASYLAIENQMYKKD